MLAKVRKLLAKAEDASCTEPEREALMERASALMAKYGIDAALAAQRDPASDKVTDKRIVVHPPYAKSMTELFWAVAAPMRCKAIRIETPKFDGKNRYEYTMHVFGYQSDIDRVELLWTSLLLQAANGIKKADVPYGYSHWSYKESWLAGFRSAVYTRLTEAEAKATSASASEGTGVELVLYDRNRLVGQAADAAHPRVRTAANRQFKATGMNAGYQAGQRADLGTSSKVGAGRSRALAG